MADVTIKNVPEGCERKVKESAALTIERYLRAEKQATVSGMGKVWKFVDDKEIEVYKKSIDDMRVANELDKIFNVTAEMNGNP